MGTRQEAEVDHNYDAFVLMLPSLLDQHRDQCALMREGRVIEYFDHVGDAYRAGVTRYSDGIFSIQEVTDEPIDLGFFSHVAF